jgi:hypothetical protein
MKVLVKVMAMVDGELDSDGDDVGKRVADMLPLVVSLSKAIVSYIL